jgi:2-deoxy-D-gluconate 3-dehydrogenase
MSGRRPNAMGAAPPLDGTVALVTGASGDIGSAIAEALSMAGAKLALHGTRAATIDPVVSRLRDLGGEAKAFAADLGETGGRTALVPRVVDAFGKIDILVNCAGITRRSRTLDVEEADYDHIMSINLKAPFMLSQQAARNMADHGGGRIINVGSLTTQVGVVGITVYGLSKAALGQMTRQMAIEWAQHNILVNCVMPGMIRTKFTEQQWADDRRRSWMLQQIPLRREGLGRDVAGAVLFLASPASSYVTGVCLPVDGGVLAGLPEYPGVS